MPLITYNVKESPIKFQDIERFGVPVQQIQYVLAFTSECEALAHKYFSSLTEGTKFNWLHFRESDKQYIVIFDE